MRFVQHINVAKNKNHHQCSTERVVVRLSGQYEKGTFQLGVNSNQYLLDAVFRSDYFTHIYIIERFLSIFMVHSC